MVWGVRCEMCGVLFCVCSEMCVHSKRSRVCRQNDRVLCDTGVLTAHTGAFRKYAWERLGQSVSLSLSLSLYFSARFSLVSSLCVLNDEDNEHSSDWLSLYTRLCLPLCARVRGPWRIRWLASYSRHAEPIVFLYKPHATWHEVCLHLR